MSLALIHIHDNERKVALYPGEQRGQQKAADATNTEKGDVLTRLDADAAKGMDRHRTRLRKRSSFTAAGLRHSQAHPGGHRHPLGETAVGVDAVEHSAVADIGAPGHARR